MALLFLIVVGVIAIIVVKVMIRPFEKKYKSSSNTFESVTLNQHFNRNLKRMKYW